LNNSDILKSYEYCKKITINHYENFPVASVLFPGSKRKHVYSIYAFARTADDIADSNKYTSNEKIDLLNEIEHDFLDSLDEKFKSKTSYSGKILPALCDTIKNFNIPEIEFLNLLKAFKQDVVLNRYNYFSELIEYSKLSANPIGHLILYISGYNPTSNLNLFEKSDKICTALQLINFWQDVSIDLNMNRIYIPSKIMNTYEYNEKLLYRKIENENFKSIMIFLVNKTYSIFNEGKSITNILNGRLKLEVKAIYNGGTAILEKIRKSDYRVLSNRVCLSKINKLFILSKSILGIGF
jgi:squalene synthase HpnC